MAPRQQRLASELRVLQEAVASAVHELSQPLNVVNLMADNALEDVAALQAAGALDAAVVGSLQRRIETIVEHAEKASDITRWIRAFAVGLDGEAAPFDPGRVIERVVGIFANDLRVAGIELRGGGAAGASWALGNEALLGFALTETVLWLSEFSSRGRATMQGPASRAPRRIDIGCESDNVSRSVVVTVAAEGVTSPAASVAALGAEGGAARTRLPPDLPLLALAGRISGCRVSLSRPGSGKLAIRISLPGEPA
jgi:hypothetical protein